MEQLIEMCIYRVSYLISGVYFLSHFIYISTVVAYKKKNLKKFNFLRNQPLSLIRLIWWVISIGDSKEPEFYFILFLKF